jgi:hypothetical protein
MRKAFNLAPRFACMQLATFKGFKCRNHVGFGDILCGTRFHHPLSIQDSVVLSASEL